MKRSRVSIFTKRQLYEAYQAGTTMTQLAIDYGLPYKLVQDICTRQIPNFLAKQKEYEGGE